MNEALKYAKIAYEMGEVPVGAVVVYDNQIIGVGYNKRQYSNKIHAHAEIEAMNMAATHLNSWNLEGCVLYVTVEPCPMCAGALMQSHVSKVVFGAFEPNSGSLGSLVALQDIKGYNHKIEVISGVLSEESIQLVRNFFKEIRMNAIKIKKVDENTFKSCLNLRIRVFVDEQGVSFEEELDEYDDLNREDVIHIAAIKSDTIIATSRYIIKGKEYKIGRVAVDKAYRGLKIGTKMLQYIEKQAINSGIESMVLGSQKIATEFYKSLGYEEYGDIFDDAGIDHIMMRKKIKTTHNE